MQELSKLAPEKGTATSAMCLFLAINTSSVTILPLGVITVRAAAGATNPASIFIPTLIATCCSTVVAIVMAKFLAAKEAAQGGDTQVSKQKARLQVLHAPGINEERLAEAEPPIIEASAEPELVLPDWLAGSLSG